MSFPSYETRLCYFSLMCGPRWKQRLNTFLELKAENQRLQYRIQELRAQQAQFVQTPSASTAPTSTASTLPPTMSSLPVQLPIDPPPSTVPDHSESAANPSPITRNLDAAGFQEGDQDEPAKKKVPCIRCSDAVDITNAMYFRPRNKFHRPHRGFV